MEGLDGTSVWMLLRPGRLGYVQWVLKGDPATLSALSLAAGELEDEPSLRQTLKPAVRSASVCVTKLALKDLLESRPDGERVDARDAECDLLRVLPPSSENDIEKGIARDARFLGALASVLKGALLELSQGELTRSRDVCKGQDLTDLLNAFLYAFGREYGKAILQSNKTLPALLGELRELAHGDGGASETNKRNERVVFYGRKHP